MRATTVFRIAGLVLVLYGGGMLALLATPWRDWALDHSIAEVVSTTDRRANNRIEGSVDEPIAIAGSGVVLFAGLWFGLLVPHVLQKHHRSMLEAAGLHEEPRDLGVPPTPAPADRAPGDPLPPSGP